MTSPIDVLFLRDTTHGGPADQPATVAARLTAFVSAAQHSLDVAIYDFRLSDSLAGPVVAAFIDAANRGVVVRIAYDAGKPPAATAATFARLAADPAPPGTANWIVDHFSGTSVQTKPITAPSGQLMHNKYIARDVGQPSATVWTGSANFTDDAWTHQENNLLTIGSSPLAAAYRNDFDQLWSAGTIEGTGAGQSASTTVGTAQVGLDFAPGDGAAIDAYLTAQVAGATSRIVVASMVLTSHPLLAALVDAVGRGVAVSGIYDAGQMDPIAKTWADHPADAAVLKSWQTVETYLVGKHSAPYRPTGVHDFMHNKVLVADDQVITGSYNLSANAEHNAENQLYIHDTHSADQYATYINTITDAYRLH